MPEVSLSEAHPQTVCQGNVDFYERKDAIVSMVIFTKRDGFSLKIHQNRFIYIIVNQNSVLEKTENQLKKNSTSKKEFTGLQN